MKNRPHFKSRTNIAFTLLELMIVVAVCVLLFLMLKPAVTSGGPKAGRINCVNNLKQVGLSFRLWAGDNGDKFPVQVSATNGETLELVGNASIASYFTVMSNELGTPKILICPDDKGRKVATNFTTLTNTNLSYFVCLNAANGSDPQMWLSGDRNVTNRYMPIRGVLNVPTNSPVGWTETIHNTQGNLVLADGSVQMLSSRKLLESLRGQTNSPLRLLLPQ